MNPKKTRIKITMAVLLTFFALHLGNGLLMAKQRRISVVGVGDLIVNRPFSIYSEERYLQLIELLRKADVACGNLEGTIHDGAGYPGYIGGSLHVVAGPYMADELKWAGFDMMGLANNHTLDFLIEGMEATEKNLDRAGIVHAGSGRNLETAGEPAYFESKNGRIALISCASTFISHFKAAATRGDMKGRPGLNPLRLTQTYQVTKEDMEILKNMGASGSSGISRIIDPEAQIYSFKGIGRFKVGPERRLISEANIKDVERITEAIKDAKKNAHIVIVYIHAHDQSGYLKKFARACIEAGADCFFGAGPHYLNGLEIFKKKPIFYSLGNFFFEVQTQKNISAEVYEHFGLDPFNSSTDDFWHLLRERQAEERRFITVAPWIVFADGKLEELILYPVSLNPQAERAGALGRPFLADDEMAEKIIKKMAALSSPHGTQIIFRDGVGRVKTE